MNLKRDYNLTKVCSLVNCSLLGSGWQERWGVDVVFSPVWCRPLGGPGGLQWCERAVLTGSPANPVSHCAPQADGAQPSTASQRDNGWQWMTAL